MKKTKSELQKEAADLHNQIVNVQMQYIKLSDYDKSFSSQAFELRKEHDELRHKLKAVNRRITLIDSAEANQTIMKAKEQKLDRLADDIIDICTDEIRFDGVFDPSGNAETYIDASVKPKLIELLKRRL